MERLTVIDGMGNAELKVCYACNDMGSDSERCGHCPTLYEAIDRLAAYEDLGFTPDELEKYVTRNLRRETTLVTIESKSSLLLKPKGYGRG